MPAEIETMAWTNEEPWHGLGVRVDDKRSVGQMMRAARLDWRVEKRPVFVDGKVVPDFYGLTRTTDGHVLDIAGKSYVPVQNEEAFEFFKEYVEAGKAKMETAGSLRGGRYVWGLANLQDSFTLAGGDRVNGYLLVAIPHEVGKAFIVKFTAVRVVCQNTLTMALKGAGSQFAMAHRRQFDHAMVVKAKETLGIAREQMADFEKTARKLSKRKMGREEILIVLGPVFQKDEPDWSVPNIDIKPRLAKVLECLEYAPGAISNTAWGVLNAATYYADHVASRTADKRLTNAWFGRTAAQKEQVLERLLEIL